MDQHLTSTRIERIVRRIVDAFSRVDEDGAIDLTRYIPPILELFGDEGEPLTLQEAIYRAERWSGICEDVGHYLREIRDAPTPTC